MAAVIRNVRSGVQYIDGLLGTNRWSDPEITFSFPTLTSHWSGYRAGEEPFTNFQALSETQKSAVRHIFTQFSSVANLDFVEVSGGAGVMRFGMSDIPATAHAYLPSGLEWAGDSWYNNSSGQYDLPVRGNYAYHTFMHEIGHALGLKHPHETDVFGAVEAGRDSIEFSVMSYRVHRGSDINLEWGYNSVEDWGFAQTLMMHDIAALQHMYGANYDHNAGNTVYQWSPTTGEMFVDGSGQGAPGDNRIFLTVWDGGGIDTYSFSNYTKPVTVRLDPGDWVTMPLSIQAARIGAGGVLGQIANAYLFEDDMRSIIENAVGGSASDALSGNQVSNRLEGRGGYDYLKGWGGADLLIGGEGNDTYSVEDSGDRIVEKEGGGIDKVESSATSYRLSAHVEHLIGMDNTKGQRLLGNAQDNRIVGNHWADFLDGGAGADTLVGDYGDDTYVVDNAGDRIVDSSFAGDDRVLSSISYRLGSELEFLTLTGNAAIKGTGNASSNRITGNGAGNVLDGAAGADIMSGRDGNDSYFVDDAGDRAIESSAAGGVDRVRSSVSFRLGLNVEHLALSGTGKLDGTGNDLGNQLTGNAADNRLYGRAGADVLSGMGGNDFLSGGTGSDIMRGGTGADSYCFDTALADAGIDRIADFAAGDTVLLDRTFFTGVGAVGTLSEGAFCSGRAAADASDRIIYDPVTGQLYYDADGIGGSAAILFARLEPALEISHADFSIIA